MESAFTNFTDEHFVDTAFVYFVSTQIGFVFVRIATFHTRKSWQIERETCGEKMHDMYVNRARNIMYNVHTF